jgi:hypothetical protein
MKYVKLFENWLNEASDANIPLLLDKAAMKEQSEVQILLTDLSQYGNLANQVKGAMSSFRSRYLPSEAWQEMNTANGLNKAFESFRELYQIATAGDETHSPLYKTMKNAFKSGIIDSFWYSADIVNAGKVIKNGDSKIAESLGASIILSQLSIAITKGLYYYSTNIPLKPEADGKLVTLKSELDSRGTYASIDSEEGLEALKGMGKSYFSTIKTETKQGYMTVGTHGRTIPSGTYEKSYLSLTEERITPFVNNLSFNTFVNNLKQTSGYNVPPYAYSILFIGTYVGERSILSLNLASAFMEKGGPSWYNEILA